MRAKKSVIEERRKYKKIHYIGQVRERESERKKESAWKRERGRENHPNIKKEK